MTESEQKARATESDDTQGQGARPEGDRAMDRARGRARGTERERGESEGQSEGQRGRRERRAMSDAEHMGMHIEHGTKIKADKIADKMLTKDADNRRATSTTEQQWLYPAIELRHWPWASCGIWRGDDICKMKVEGVGCASAGRCGESERGGAQAAM